ncbi:MAG: ammonium transporter [Planctomycetes bacterium]|nr:ammonium transporter [Planctomycetota bacterium]
MRSRSAIASVTLALTSFLILGGGAATAWADDAALSVPVTATDSGATAWMLTSTALVLLMVPGLAMFYGGLVRTKNVIGTMMHSFVAMAIIGVMWSVCGYAMAFGPSVLGGWCGWDSGKFMLGGLDGSVVKPMGVAVPEYVFAMFQGKFAVITPALIAGAIAERVRFRGYCVLIALWGVLVYNPLAHWVWAGDGFLFNMGAIDFAGGTVVHISAGISALVMALYLGARKGYPGTAMQPNNLVMTLMGAGLLWVGWFGFNAGSAVQSDNLTARALTVTQVAAATGALAWILIEALRHRKATSLGLCSGILAGLVAITPAAGAVGVGGAIALGAAASVLCYFAIILKTRLGYDDTLDVFGIHGAAGIFGALALSLFILNDSVTTKTWSEQLAIQATAVGIAIAYSAVCSIILVVLVDKTLGLRLDDTREMAGMDHALHGEHGYGLLNLN